MVDTYTKRFHTKYEIVNDCWEWTDYLQPNGYCTFWNGTKKEYGHRFSYRKFVGEIPEKMCIDHICKNRKCVNPKHLRLVTRGQNTLYNSNSCTAKNKQKTKCINGHLLVDSNLYYEKLKNGSLGRKCKKCVRLRQKERTKNGYNKRMYRKNIEKRRKYAREWYRKNKVGIIKRLPY